MTSVVVHNNDSDTAKINDDFVTVKGSGDVILKANLSPSGSCDAITWESAGGSITSPGVGSDKCTAKMSRDVSKKVLISIKCNGNTLWEGTVWVIWSWLEVTIGTSDTIDWGPLGTNDATELVNGNSPAWLGGGNNLGEIDHDGTPGLIYRYTVGKIQARAVLRPVGIEDIVQTGWHMKRTIDVKSWDNSGHYSGGVWLSGPWTKTGDDTSLPGWTDLDPTSGTSAREIYDLDAPGCSRNLPGLTIYYTSERYSNFTQYATVDLPGLTPGIKCSDDVVWSYEAWVDMDKAAGNRAEANKLMLSSITIPSTPHYSKRSPTITGINPNSGPTAGGTAVTISGTNFTHTISANPTVTIGGNAATNVVLVSTTSITCNTPAGTVGAKDVVVTVPDGQSTTLTNGFTYT